jgi:hypothetical protein
MGTTVIIHRVRFWKPDVPMQYEWTATLKQRQARMRYFSDHGYFVDAQAFLFPTRRDSIVSELNTLERTRL